MLVFELIKSVLLGIIEGITEWLPVSSTGHLLLFDNVLPLNQSEAFRNLLVEVIQLAAILAVVIIYFSKLWPFSPKKTKEEKIATWILLAKIVVSAIPGGIAVLIFKLLDFDLPDNPFVIAGALIVYGIFFIILERKNANKTYRIVSADDIGFKEALIIGAFQVLSIIPGTSRSGSTILGASLIGVSRGAAADFSFLLAIPAMAGASGIAVLSFVMDMMDGDMQVVFGTEQIAVLAVACVVSFAVSFIAVKFLVSFVRRHSFEVFGWYRIALAVLVIVYFCFFK